MVAGCGAGDAVDPPSDVSALSSGGETVATSGGSLRGARSDEVLTFLGIPYAEPPTGKNRFRPSVPAAPWSGVKSADAYGPACMQLDLVTGKPTGSEDCLTLNVWTPATRGQRPVMVFIHGGGELIGAANQRGLIGNLYDGADLARRQDAVVISFNYRLGPFGFLAHPAIAGANHGLYDAVLALQWVQKNAAAFGGDPSHVLLFGESAGAFNTCALVASPLARGLFSSALMESGNCGAPTKEERYPRGRELATEVGCNDLECLQNAPADAITKAGGSFFSMTPRDRPIEPRSIAYLSFGPSVDGALLPQAPIDALRDGRHNHVPLVIGTNRDEVSLFAAIPGEIPLTCGDYKARLEKNFGAFAEQVLKRYPCSVLNPVSGHDAYVKVISGAFFTCPSRRAARAAASSQTEPVYRYLYTHRFDYGPLWLLGPAHTMELPFVFRSFGALGYLPTPGEKRLSERIQQRWAAFARTGNPNVADEVAWLEYGADDAALVLDTTESTLRGYDREGCDLWDTVQ
jgi:para-nitrobenzyl esterase